MADFDVFFVQLNFLWMLHSGGLLWSIPWKQPVQSKASQLRSVQKVFYNESIHLNTLQTFRIGPQKRNAWSLNGMICNPTDLETNTSYFFCVASLPQKACASDFGGLEKSPRCCHVAAVAAVGVHSPEMWEKSGPFEGQSDGAAKRWGAEDLSKDVGQSNRTRILIFPVFPGVIIHDAAEEPWNDNHDGHHGTMMIHHHHHHHLAIEMQVFPAHYQNDDWHQVTLQPEEVPSAWPHRKQRSSRSFRDNDSCVTL